MAVTPNLDYPVWRPAASSRIGQLTTAVVSPVELSYA
jgi:hypothetical protein